MTTTARPSTHAQRRSGPARDLRFHGEGFVFDAVWGTFHRISPTAAFLLRAIEAGAAARDLPGLLVQRYGIDPARAARDTERFVQDLRAIGLMGGAP